MRLSTRMWRKLSGKSFLIGLTTVMAVVAMAVTGVQSPGGIEPNLAAKVGDQIVTLRSLQSTMNRQSRRNMESEQEQRDFLRSTLDSLIQELVIVEEANRIGWSGNDLEVAAWIREIEIFKDETQKTFSKKKYDEFLKSGQLSELELFQDGRESLATQKYSRMLSLETHIPKTLASEMAKRDAISFEIDYLDLNAPAERVEALIREKVTAFASDEANAEELKQAYEARRTDFNKPSSPRISAILIAHKDAKQAQGTALDRSKEAALVRAQEILSKIKAGEDFSLIANRDSDDVKTTSTKNGGDLGFVDETSLDPVALEAGRALQSNGDVSEVIDTDFGYRVLKRTDLRPAVSKSLDDVKNELAETLLRPRVSNELNAAIRARFEEILGAKSAEPDSSIDNAGENKQAATGKGDLAALDEAANEFGLNWKSVETPVQASSRFITGLGPAETVVPELFGLQKEGDLVPSIMTVSGRSLLIRLRARNTSEVSEEAIKSKRDVTVASERSQFVTESRRALYDLYSANKEIKRNAKLFESIQ